MATSQAKAAQTRKRRIAKLRKNREMAAHKAVQTMKNRLSLEEKILKLRKKNKSMSGTAIAKKVGVSAAFVYKTLKKHAKDV